MSGLGIPQTGLSNILNLARPDLAAEQMQQQQRQAFANSLLQQQPQYSGIGGALDTLGSKLLGALTTRSANKKALEIANQYRGALFDPSGDQSPASQGQQVAPAGPPLASMPPGGLVPPVPGQPNSAIDAAPLPPLASMPQGGAMAAPQPQQVAQNSAPAPTPVRAPQSGQSLFDRAVPDIPGVDPRNKFVLYASDPANYMKAYYGSIGLTDAEKNASEAFGRGTPEYQQHMQQLAAKSVSTVMRPGGGIFTPGQGITATMPNSNGVQFQQGPGGQMVANLAPGAANAIQASDYAAAIGKAGAKPATGFDPATNQPVATNAAVMATGGQIQPGAPAPEAGGSAPPFAGPIGQSIVKALFPGAQITSGQRTPGHNAAVGGVPDSQHLDGSAVDFTLPPGKTFADVQAAFTQSGLPASELINEGNHVHWAWGAKPQKQAANGGALLPELPPGQAAYAGGQAKDAADRHDSTVAAAQESPMRINVLDNIIDLSKSGVATGPGQEWQNAVLGYMANAPGLSKVMGAAKDNVGRFQELQKFTYQNAIRSWQAAGGTGTDAQMQSMAHANPNDHLFPQALQTIAKWGKAGELAVQGKANAQDKFLAENGNSPTAQIKFENQWRNSFDPKVFQYSLMSPQEKQQFAQQTLKTPAAAKEFIAKQEQLKALGAIP